MEAYASTERRRSYGLHQLHRYKDEVTPDYAAQKSIASSQLGESQQHQ
jgi:hypothetical protein